MRVPLHVLYWNDCTVLKLAIAIKKSQQFSDLPILADALEEAGYTDQFMLKDLRTNPRGSRYFLGRILKPGWWPGQVTPHAHFGIEQRGRWIYLNGEKIY